MGIPGIFITLLCIAFIFVAISKFFIIVNQAEVIIIEMLGKYSRTLPAGLHIIIPFFETPRKMLKLVKRQGLDGRLYSTTVYAPRIDMRETVYDFPRQNVITKDNVTISINALLYFQITDPRRAVYSIENFCHK